MSCVTRNAILIFVIHQIIHKPQFTSSKNWLFAKVVVKDWPWTSGSLPQDELWKIYIQDSLWEFGGNETSKAIFVGNLRDERIAVAFETLGCLWANSQLCSSYLQVNTLSGHFKYEDISGLVQEKYCLSSYRCNFLWYRKTKI